MLRGKLDAYVAMGVELDEERTKVQNMRVQLASEKVRMEKLSLSSYLEVASVFSESRVSGLCDPVGSL